MPPIGIPSNFQTEIIYSFVIILCSLMIYFGTKELYELSSHKGIGYLRKSFLFFAVAFFFGSFIKIFFTLSNTLLFREYSEIFFQPISLFIFIYFSSIAVFYLVYSMMWKHWKNQSNITWIFHAIAFLISAVSIVLNSARIYLMMNFLIFAFVIASMYFVNADSRKTKKKKSSLYAIYMLLFIFWILNVTDVLIPNFLQTFELLIHLASIGIFMTILYKVLKKSGSN